MAKTEKGHGNRVIEQNQKNLKSIRASSYAHKIFFFFNRTQHTRVAGTYFYTFF